MNVLDADPELGAAIPADRRELAARGAVAQVVRLGRGPWPFSPEPDPGSLGALILDGLIVVRIDVGTRAHIELLGQGDVICPWVGMEPDLARPSTVTATILEDVQIALLSRGFALRTGGWPEIHAAIVRRLVVRSRRLSLQSAINAVPRVEERLELTLWKLADRFGRVTGDGVALDLPLPHALIAELVASARPSVTVAFARLERHGRLIRNGRGHIILLGPPPAKLAPLAHLSGLK